LPIFEKHRFFTGEKDSSMPYKDLAWYNEKGEEFKAADWQNTDRHALSYMAFDGENLLYVALNGSTDHIAWKMPACPKMKHFKLLFSTAEELKFNDKMNGQVIDFPPESIFAFYITRG
ncbi:MAG: hypothetical protein J6X42_03320, partial [Alphaproteobacteria bacterium]|nr:hypothetical protein [Alphaproteobacteria bacterium]